MARRHSDEERSAGQGGRVTDPSSGESTLRSEQLGSDWKNTLDELEVGEISPPREARLLGPQRERAFHIVKLEDRTPRHRLNLDQDYARIKEFALQEKQQRVYQRWVRELREDVYVDVRTPPAELSARAY
jgi:peptidyl-prolyl cis-trans isomerase SurA